jgi:CubicO group peptidase (beta-lactamase class C family)
MRMACDPSIGSATRPKAESDKRTHHLSGASDFVGYGEGIYEAGEFYGHGGNIPEVSSTMWYLPEKDATIIVNVNRYDQKQSSGALSAAIIQILFPKYTET